MVTDLAPVSRRGEAVSYWSVAVWSGLAFGPVLGEALLDGSDYDLVWYVAGAFGARRRARRARRPPRRAPTSHGERGKVIAPAAIRPGIILALHAASASPGSASSSRSTGRRSGSTTSVWSSCCTASWCSACASSAPACPTRSARSGPGRIATAATAVGLRGRRGVAQHGRRWSIGTMIIAVGSSFLYPSLLLLAFRGVPEQPARLGGRHVQRVLRLRQRRRRHRARRHRRRSSSYQGAFAASAGLAAVALLLLRSGFGHHETGSGADGRRGRAGDHRTRRRCRDRAARHQRLPAEDRRDPVVPLRAVASAPRRTTRRCSPPATTATRAWDAQQALPGGAGAGAPVLPDRVAGPTHRRAGARGRRAGDPPRPVVAARAARPAAAAPRPTSWSCTAPR